MSINWFPGHMHKATQEIKQSLPQVDIIIEVLDARIPYSSENPVIRQLCSYHASDQAKGGATASIKLLNKADLADPEQTQAWIAHFEQRDNVRAIAISQKNPERITELIQLCKQIAAESLAKSGSIDVLIMGIPNVGKSTIINTLAGKQIAKTGNEPAVTKGQQKINLRNGIMLWDTPGILWAKFDNQQSAYRLAATGAIKDTAISNDDIAFFASDHLIHHHNDLLVERYKLEKPPETEVEFLDEIGLKRGALGKGGRVNLEKISKQFLTELRDGTIGRITLETPAMAIKEQQVMDVLIAQREQEKLDKKAARKAKFQKKKAKKGKA
jgi:ribosome biogenesis GTPase A